MQGTGKFSKRSGDPHTVIVFSVRCQSLNCELIHMYCLPLIHNSSFDTGFILASRSLRSKRLGHLDTSPYLRTEPLSVKNDKKIWLFAKPSIFEGLTKSN